ncbi:hypothetical protein QUG48_11670, partial [Enterobacter hormaechei]
SAPINSSLIAQNNALKQTVKAFSTDNKASSTPEITLLFIVASAIFKIHYLLTILLFAALSRSNTKG